MSFSKINGLEEILQEPDLSVVFTPTTITYTFVGQDTGDDGSVVVCGDE